MFNTFGQVITFFGVCAVFTGIGIVAVRAMLCDILRDE